MSGPFDWEQADRAIGQLMNEGKCIMCKGTGILKRWDNKYDEWYETTCPDCNGTGEYDYA